MHELHSDTVEFLYGLLKKQQLRQAEQATTARAKAERNAYDNLQNRLLLELNYGRKANGPN